MTFSQIILSQLMDPFRIILLVGLVWTMMRTRAVSGTLIPLAAGIVFVAVLIPLTLSAQSEIPVLDQLLAGLISNSVIVGIVLGIWELASRARRG